MFPCRQRTTVDELLNRLICRNVYCVVVVIEQADILVVASGHPHTLTADMAKDGAVIIDVGVNRIPDSTKKSGFRLIGDCDFDELKEKASYITPVPGGVGPMTIAMLMQNTLESALRNL